MEKIKHKTKTRQVHIRGTPEQIARWGELAARENRSISNWGARVLDAYAASLAVKGGA